MTTEEILCRVLDGLAAVDIPYVLVGSFASNVYGIPRATQDADFVVQLGPGKLAELTAVLGADFVLDPQWRFETITGTQRAILRERETEFIIELFRHSNEPHDRERFARRKPLSIRGRTAWVLSPEDVVITKLHWLLLADRKKDYIDVQNVIAVRGGALDWSYVESWCDRHGSRKLLEQICAELR